MVLEPQVNHKKSSSKKSYTYHWKHYNQLSKEELYQIMILRQEVFVVEQECAYQDADELDRHSFHHFITNNTTATHSIAAYLRVIEPIENLNECTIGRVLTRKSERGNGLAQKLIQKSFIIINEELTCTRIKISAQQYLEKFYLNLGFTPTSEPYDEDGIPHIAMIKQ